METIKFEKSNTQEVKMQVQCNNEAKKAIIKFKFYNKSAAISIKQLQKQLQSKIKIQTVPNNNYLKSPFNSNTPDLNNDR